MEKQNENEIKTEQPVTLQERWRSDEGLSNGGVFEVKESPCKSCKFARPDTVESCQVYSPLPWDFLTGKAECPDYRSRS